jgi:hypothetical protein
MSESQPQPDRTEVEEGQLRENAAGHLVYVEGEEGLLEPGESRPKGRLWHVIEVRGRYPGQRYGMPACGLETWRLAASLTAQQRVTELERERDEAIDSLTGYGHSERLRQAEAERDRAMEALRKIISDTREPGSDTLIIAREALASTTNEPEGERPQHNHDEPGLLCRPGCPRWDEFRDWF